MVFKDEGVCDIQSETNHVIYDHFRTIRDKCGVVLSFEDEWNFGIRLLWSVRILWDCNINRFDLVEFEFR